MNTYNSAAVQQQLFDLVKRPDGKWVVWIRKSPVDLGIVSKAKLEGWRDLATKGRVKTVTDEEYSSFASLPHNQEPIWVIHAIYDTKPTIDSVLGSLGVQRRKTSPGNTKAKAPSKPRTSPVKAAA